MKRLLWAPPALVAAAVVWIYDALQGVRWHDPLWRDRHGLNTKQQKASEVQEAAQAKQEGGT